MTRRRSLAGFSARLLAAVVAACLLAACSSPGPASVASGTASSSAGFPRIVTDGAGRPIRLAAKPVRIVSQTLASDEMLFAMVRPERLVGLSSLARDPKYSNVVAEATAQAAPSIETAEDVLRLKPDLVFVTTYSRAEVVQLLEATGAPVYRLANFDDIDGVMANVRRVGEAVGEERAAEQIVADMERRLTAVAARRVGRPQLRVLSFSGGFTAGLGTSFDDIARRAGAINEASARGLQKFPKIGEEQVLAWNPDVIVAGYLPGEQDAVRRRLVGGPGLAQTTAARRQRIVLLETRLLLAVSQHIVGAVEQLAAALDTFQAAP